MTLPIVFAPVRYIAGTITRILGYSVIALGLNAVLAHGEELERALQGPDVLRIVALGFEGPLAKTLLTGAVVLAIVRPAFATAGRDRRTGRRRSRLGGGLVGSVLGSGTGGYGTGGGIAGRILGGAGGGGLNRTLSFGNTVGRVVRYVVFLPVRMLVLVPATIAGYGAVEFPTRFESTLAANPDYVGMIALGMEGPHWWLVALGALLVALIWPWLGDDDSRQNHDGGGGGFGGFGNRGDNGGFGVFGGSNK